MTFQMRCALGLLIVLASIFTASCNGEGGVGAGASVPRARWGGGNTGPGVIVMGGGPVY